MQNISFAYKCVLVVRRQPPYKSFFFIQKPKQLSSQYDVILLRPLPQTLMYCPILAYFHPQSVVRSLSFSPRLSSCSDNNGSHSLIIAYVFRIYTHI